MSEARGPGRSGKGWRVARRICCGLLVVAGVLVGIVLASWVYLRLKIPEMRYMPMLGDGAPVAGGIEEISDMMGVDFPASATLTNSRLMVWFGPNLYARIEMDAADIEPFVASLPEPKWTSRDERLGILDRTGEKNDPWWTPMAPRSYLAVKVNMPLKEYNECNRLQLLFDLDVAPRTVMYLYWCGE